MKRFWTSIVGWIAAGFAALCCFGIPLALSGLALLGIPFLVSDFFLVPLMLVALAVFLWGIYRTSTRSGMWPLIFSIAGAVLAFAGIWLSIAISAAGFALMAVGFIIQMVLQKHQV